MDVAATILAAYKGDARSGSLGRSVPINTILAPREAKRPLESLRDSTCAATAADTRPQSRR